MWTEVELAYLAGIIDGEGSIGIYHRASIPSSLNSNSYDCSIQISNTDPNLIQWIADKFGGSLKRYDIRYEESRRKSWKPLYRVSWSAKEDVYSILSDVYKYLIVKKRLAELMFAFITIPISDMEMRDVAYTEFREFVDSYKNNGRLYAGTMTETTKVD